jgi:predicted enzyme related to lactoylglutathione lyase
LRPIRPAVIDHVSFAVQPGMMDYAIDFFTAVFDWKEIEERRVSTMILAIAFIDVGSPVVLQLTDDGSFDWVTSVPIATGTHLAIRVTNAYEAQELISKYAREKLYYARNVDAIPVHTERANKDGSKWFVELPELLAFKIELVTADS